MKLEKGMTLLSFLYAYLRCFLVSSPQTRPAELSIGWDLGNTTVSHLIDTVYLIFNYQDIIKNSPSNFDIVPCK